MYKYYVLEVRDENYCSRLVICEEKFYYSTFKEKMSNEGKFTKVIIEFEYPL